MKRTKYFTLSVFLSLFLAGSICVQAQQIFKTTDTSVIGYLEYLPADYHANSDKYPVVIFLHGIGERGYDSTDPAVLSTCIQRVAKIGPPMFVKNGTQFPFILISPQLKSNYGNWPSGYVMEVINYVKTYLRIDEKRIYLTGLSLGGGGAWWTAQDHPELFAALAPVCGGRNSPSLACGIAAENLPVWAFHGDKDTIVPLSRTVNMVNAINACVPKINPEAKLTVYPGVAHDAWNYAYRIDNSLHTPNVYEWMLAFKNTINKGNTLPSANAGSDKSVSGSSTAITGSASDPDGSIATYLWTQLSGPSPATLTNNTGTTLTASGLLEGKYVFSFRATDNGGASDTDYISVNISNINELPVASAGADQTIFLPTNSVKLMGTGTDSDGTVQSFGWTKISGPDVTLSGANTSSLTASNLVSGTYVLRLTVTDNLGAENYDEVSVFVKQPIAPVANAGPNKIVILPSSLVTLSGSATDADGTIVSYQWVKKSGAACNLSGVTTASLNVSGLLGGAYVFRLAVTDNSGMTDYDDVLVNVTLPPVVDAGPDQSLDLQLASITLTGSAWDPDGTIKSYTWSKYSGPAVSLADKNTPSLTLSDIKEGTYVFILKAVDNLYVKSTDYVTVTVNNLMLSTSSATLVTSKSTEQKMAMIIPGEEQTSTMRPILGSKTSSDLENSVVTIFNGSGEKIFSGAWTLTDYNEVLSQNGFYIYNVTREGKRVDSGKIYIRH